jgi:hypothetical protein
MEYKLGSIVRIKESGELGIVVHRYFWGKVGLIYVNNRNKSFWFNEKDNDVVEFVSDRLEEEQQ